MEAKSPVWWRLASAAVKAGENALMGGAIERIIDKNCVKCGVCAKVCPTGNIIIGENVSFGDNCEMCLGCVHLCPQNALHLKNEKSAARWRNPDVGLNEIIESNRQSLEA
jgi:ferredoxin